MFSSTNSSLTTPQGLHLERSQFPVPQYSRLLFWLVCPGPLLTQLVAHTFVSLRCCWLLLLFSCAFVGLYWFWLAFFCLVLFCLSSYFCLPPLATSCTSTFSSAIPGAAYLCFSSRMEGAKGRKQRIGRQQKKEAIVQGISKRQRREASDSLARGVLRLPWFPYASHFCLHYVLSFLLHPKPLLSPSPVSLCCMETVQGRFQTQIMRGNRRRYEKFPSGLAGFSLSKRPNTCCY